MGIDIIKKLGENWTPPHISEPNSLAHGDMPGDKINICGEQVDKSVTLFEALKPQLAKALKENPNQKAVVALCGGSGSGKSGMAAILAHYLNELGIGTYIMSGDNYPRRIPCENDAERVRIFRKEGINGLLGAGLYNDKVKDELKNLQLSETDSDTSLCEKYPWLNAYQKAGRSGLCGYLGTDNEQDYKELSDILSRFKNGQQKIFLKRMGRTPTDLWYDEIDMSKTNVIILEWTHSNNERLIGVDVPILLNSTPQETLEYRLSRNRDGGADSPFVSMVLDIEQRMLDAQAYRAKIILSKKGELLSYSQYRLLMAQSEER